LWRSRLIDVPRKAALQDETRVNASGALGDSRIELLAKVEQSQLDRVHGPDQVDVQDLKVRLLRCRGWPGGKGVIGVSLESQILRFKILGGHRRG
jgi:hypothetical protein